MASLKQFIGDAKDLVTRITGLTPWTAPPAINLETTSAQLKAITGNAANDAAPAISLATTSEQIKLITGEATNSAAPDISLAGTQQHVDTTPATGSVHGITGWDMAPVALGTAAAGTATKIARGDHVHPTTGLMTTGHAANAITGLNATPVALGDASAGNATTVARSNHVHPTTGLMTTGHAANAITGFGATSAALDDSGLNGNSTLVARSDHVHPRTGLMTTVHAANAISGFATTAVALAATQDPGNVTTVARGNHVHPTTGLMTTGHAANAITGFGYVPVAMGPNYAAGSGTNVARIDHVHPYPSGYGGRQGTGGGTTGSPFNIYWAGTAAQLWIDTTLVGTLTTSSDYRLKRAVTPVAPGALARVLQLRPVTYRWRPVALWQDDGVSREGFVAHEVQAIIPSAVDGDKDAVTSAGAIQPQSLLWAPLVAVLTAAVQELAARVVALEARA